MAPAANSREGITALPAQDSRGLRSEQKTSYNIEGEALPERDLLKAWNLHEYELHQGIQSHLQEEISRRPSKGQLETREVYLNNTQQIKACDFAFFKSGLFDYNLKQ
jgi:hypothetical protein